MRTAIRILTQERRWLSEAMERLLIEADGADEAHTRLLMAQSRRLVTEMCEVIHALEILNAVESRERRVNRLPY